MGIEDLKEESFKRIESCRNEFIEIIKKYQLSFREAVVLLYYLHVDVSDLGTKINETHPVTYSKELLDSKLGGLEKVLYKIDKPRHSRYSGTYIFIGRFNL